MLLDCAAPAPMIQASAMTPLVGQGAGAKSLLIEGWRGINHSFALVNQHQILDLLKLDGLKLSHRDLPFAFPHWTRASNGSGFAPDDQQLIDGLTDPDGDVDCVYRICAPFRRGPADDRRKTVTFMITELGLTAHNFEGGHEATDVFTQGDNRIATGSRWARDRLAEWGFPDDRITVIPHGVDDALFRPLSLAERRQNRAVVGCTDDEVLFLNIGLASWNKGIDLLLLAFATLRQNGRKVRLILKDQRDVYGRSVEDTIRTLGQSYPDLIRDETMSAISVISTNISRAELRCLYGIADCYVSPYRAEGFNLPVLESIACGTPVIVTKGGATDDFCTDDVALRVSGVLGTHTDPSTGAIGRFIEPNLGELAEAMDAFVRGRPRELQGFERGRADILRTFTWRNAARQLAKLTVGYDIAEPDAAVAPSAPPGGAVASSGRPALVNVALGGSASQSSYAPFSQPGESANVISGRMPSDFGFHTETEDRPWWMVDLGTSYPIEAIVVHNRIHGFHDRARTLAIEISEDRQHWILIHAGFARFGVNGRPFESWIGSELRARYIRLSLTENQMLHLAQVEVLARADLVAFERYLAAHGLANYHHVSTDFGRPYGVERHPLATSHTIVGLKINYSGRFGNLFQQYTHALQLAKRTDLKYVQFGHNDLLDITDMHEVDGLTLLPAEAEMPRDGAFLVGSFFNSDTFAPVLSPFLHFRPEDEQSASLMASTFIRPFILKNIPLPGERHFADELTIHIRSGDVFSAEQIGTQFYRQPPLSFYTLVIERMRAKGTIARVRLVFEDRGNPCIDKLEDWLRQQDIPCRIQCGTLHEDASALIDAPHLVFGYGTFGYAICRLSKRIETVHFFTPELGGCYEHIPTIRTVYAVSDGEGRYIKAGEWGVAAGEWFNTPEQRTMMETYPAEALVLKTLRRDGKMTSSKPRRP